jgi:hypothetical protein
MSTDRFIDFPKGKRPKKAEVELVVRNFFGDGAEKVEWSQKSLIVKLVGMGTFPFEGLVDEHGPVTDHFSKRRERWIEVYATRGHMDVITRMQDEYTMVLADGLAEVFRRYWS